MYLVPSEVLKTVVLKGQVVLLVAGTNINISVRLPNITMMMIVHCQTVCILFTSRAKL